MKTFWQNRFVVAIVRSFLIFALAFPAAPAMAGMLHAAGDTTVDENCLNTGKPGFSASGDHVLAHDAIQKDHEKCENSCCPDGKCNCKNECLRITASNTFSMLSKSFPLFLINDWNKRFSSLENHAANKPYLPELRPPIS